MFDIICEIRDLICYICLAVAGAGVIILLIAYLTLLGV